MCISYRSNMLFSTPWYGTVLYSSLPSTLLYCIVSGQYKHLRVPVYNLDSDFNSYLQRMIVVSRVLDWPKVLGLKRCQGWQGLKVPRVTRVLGLKILLRCRVFSRTHLRSSLTPEEGPSCSNIYLHVYPNPYQMKNY